MSHNLRKDVLRLYRDILRTARVFHRQLDASGQDYAALLAASARKEFESARTITSREQIYRRLIVGRDALYQIHDKVCCYPLSQPPCLMYIDQADASITSVIHRLPKNSRRAYVSDRPPVANGKC